MAAPARDAVEMYTSITGASVPVAVRALEEHGGDLNRALNAHYSEDHMIQAAIVESLQETYLTPGRKEEPVLKEVEDLSRAVAQSLKIGEPEKENTKHEEKDKDPELGTPAAGDSADDMKEGSNKEHGGDPTRARNAHFGEDVSATKTPASVVNPYHSSTSRTDYGQLGTLPILSAARTSKQSSLLDASYRRKLLDKFGLSGPSNKTAVGYPVSNIGGTEVSNSSSQSGSMPLPPPRYPAKIHNTSLYQDSDEDQMIQAAIKASLQEASSRPGRREEPVPMEDEDLSRAIAQSLMIGEPEKANMKHEVKDKDPELGTLAAGDSADDMKEGSNEESQGSLGTGADSLPEDPASDDENAINVVIHMPDGKRHGCRFFKTDKLQSLFAFIDHSELATPDSYKLVTCDGRDLAADACSKTLGESVLASNHKVHLKFI